MVNSILLSALAERYEMLHLDTGRTEAGAGKEGRLAPINLRYFLSQVVRLLAVLSLRRPRILHQAVTDRLAFFKEATFMLLARLCGVRVVAHLHGPVLDSEFRSSGRLKRGLMRAALRVPHLILALSEYWRQFLAEEVAAGLNVAVVPNAIDPAIAAAMEQWPERWPGAPCSVLFLGWVGTRKGVLDALRAVPHVLRQEPAVRFVFAGPAEAGPGQEVVQQACRAVAAAGQASFPGLVTRESKLALLSEASIFILPSYHEGLPVAILEAMAAGLAVVATPVGGIPELIEDGVNGFLVEPGDYRALADRIVLLVRDPALRVCMGEANVARVRSEYLPEVFGSRIAAAYEGLLSGGRPARAAKERMRLADGGLGWPDTGDSGVRG